jgi:branched-chain amino acid transport system substrate-binding protein
MDYSLLFLHRNANHVWCIIDIMYKTKWTLGIFIILLGVTTLYAAPPIKLGMSGAFTGPSGKLGTQLLAGSSLYFDKLNAEGGIHGQWVQIQSYDDRYDPLITVYNTIKLLQHDRVSILFQYVGTPTTTLMLPLLNASDSHPLLMFAFTGSETLREMPYQAMTYNFRASYREETKALVDFFITKKKYKIAILYQSDAYGRSGWDGVRKALHKHNLELVAEATYEQNFPFEKSMKAQTDILKNGQPDALIIIGSYAATAAFIRDARNSHWDIPIGSLAGSLSFVGVDSLLEQLNAPASQNQKTYENIYITQVLPYYKDASLPAIREYLTLAKEAGQTPSYIGLEGYINAKLLSQLLLKTTAPFAIEKLSALLERNHRIDIGLEEPVSIGGKEHQGSHHVYLTQITRGILTPVQGAP